jgi:FG-GAP-like repeat
LNGDGKPDLVVAEADTSTVGVFIGNGDGTFKSEVQYRLPALPLFLVADDFTGDGKVDIAVGMIGSTATGSVAVLPGDGQGHLGASIRCVGLRANRLHSKRCLRRCVSERLNSMLRRSSHRILPAQQVHRTKKPRRADHE